MPMDCAVFHGIIEERHHGHLRDEAFGAAEARRDQEQLERVDELPRLLVVALDQERDDAAEAAHLLLGDRVIGMRLEAGIPDLFDLGMLLQEARDRQAGAVVLLHAQAEGLQAAFQQEAGERARASRRSSAAAC